MKRCLYKRYLLVILLLILAFNSVDRVALGVLLQEIKVDLALTDTQLGFMSGIAFALFYSLMGIPLGRWSDRADRVGIIALTTALWSVMVALCGVAGNFAQLLIIRVGVGIGEAGCVPAANSLIAEEFTRAQRPRAAALYWLGTPLGVAIGYFFAGWLNRFYGWRLTFVLLGAPGVVLAAVAWWTLGEPRRSRCRCRTDFVGETLALADSAHAAAPTLRTVFTTLWANSTFRHLLFCLSVMYFFNYGILQWQPSFFIRSYGTTSGELGTWFALVCGLGGLVGTYLGGAWASRRAPEDERAQLRAAAAVFVSLGVISPFIYLSSNQYVAFVVLAIVNVAGSTISGPFIGTVQTLVPGHMRATAIALIFLFANLIGMGLGPLAAGTLSDALQPWVGKESLRYALLALTPGYFWVAWHFRHASRTVTRDLKAAQSAGSFVQA